MEFEEIGRVQQKTTGSKETFEETSKSTETKKGELQSSSCVDTFENTFDTDKVNFKNYPLEKVIAEESVTNTSTNLPVPNNPQVILQLSGSSDSQLTPCDIVGETNFSTLNNSFDELFNKIKKADPELLNLINLNKEFLQLKQKDANKFISKELSDSCSTALNDLCTKIHECYAELISSVEYSWQMHTFCLAEFETRISTALQHLLNEDFKLNYFNWAKGEMLSSLSVKFEKYLKEIEMYKALIESTLYLKTLQGCDLDTLSNENLSEKIKDINNRILEIEKIIKTSEVHHEIFKNASEALVSYNNVKYDFKTYLSEYTNVNIFCSSVDILIQSVGTLKGNLKKIQKLKSKAEQLIFVEKISSKKLDTKLLIHRNKLKTFVSEMHEMEKGVKNIQRIEETILEFSKNKEKIQKIKKIEQLKVLITKDKELQQKYTNDVSCIRSSFPNVLKKFPKLRDQIAKNDNFVAKHQKDMERQEKFFYHHEALLAGINGDTHLLEKCQSNLNNKAMSEIERILNDLMDQIKVFESFNLKEFKKELEPVKLDHAQKLKEARSKLRLKLSKMEKQTLDENAAKKEDFCNKISRYWGGRKLLDDLLEEISNFYKTIYDYNVLCEENSCLKEEILKDLEYVSELYRNKVHIYESKESLDQFEKKILEAGNLIKQMETKANIQMQNIEELLNTVHDYLQGLDKFETHNDTRLQHDVKQLNETLRKHRVKLETLQLQYEMNYVEEETDSEEIWENKLLEINKLNPNLRYLSEIGLSLIRIVHKIDTCEPDDAHLMLLKSELEDKHSLLQHYNPDDNKEDEKAYKAKLILIYDIINDKLKDVKKSDEIVDLKKHSLKATYFYAKIASANSFKQPQSTRLKTKVNEFKETIKSLALDESLEENRKYILNLLEESLTILAGKTQ